MEGSGSLRFLGLEENEEGPWDVAILQIPLEMTTSYGDGTSGGPQSCVEASIQVELFDPMLPNDLPCGARMHTAMPWSSNAPDLRSQLDSIRDYMLPWVNGGAFPLVLGGEHGILLPIMEALKEIPGSDFSELTIVQIDAHADLRDELNGEKYSHGTVIRRSLEAGISSVIQIGVRAYCAEEGALIESDNRIRTWFARDLFPANGDSSKWCEMIASLEEIEGPVWLTFDVDGLDGALVPSTGTPVPGGLSHWGAVEAIERLFCSSKCEVIGADINEIVPDTEGSLTQFSAALVATKIVSCHINELLKRKGGLL